MLHITFFKSIHSVANTKEYLFPSLRICRIASGCGDWDIGGHVFRCSTGSIVLLNNLTPRKIVCVQSAPMVIDVFDFSPAYIQKSPILINTFYSEKTNILQEGTCPLLHAVLDLIASAYTLVRNENFFECQMQAAFCLLEQHYAFLSAQTTHSNIAFEAARLIWDHFAEPISVLVVAKRLNVSKNYLESAFKKVHGICVGEYIRSIRIYNVMQQLKARPDMSVLEAAFSCGFGSSSGFYKAYKSMVGDTPRRQSAP